MKNSVEEIQKALRVIQEECTEASMSEGGCLDCPFYLMTDDVGRCAILDTGQPAAWGLKTEVKPVYHMFKD